MALDASVALGDLLLKGWTMTADNCPSCKVPLMQNPADQSLVCVGCLETIEETLSHSIPIRTQTPQTLDERLGPYAQSSDQTSTMMEDEQPEEDISNKLACKMLQGYTLLSENCQWCRTPLVQKGNELPAECVVCQSTASNHATTSQPPTKRISSPNTKSQHLSTKRHQPGQENATSVANLHVKDWRMHTETVLTQKIVQLTMGLEAESSREEINKIVSSMQLCLDVLLKLKEFCSS